MQALAILAIVALYFGALFYIGGNRFTRADLRVDGRAEARHRFQERERAGQGVGAEKDPADHHDDHRVGNLDDLSRELYWAQERASRARMGRLACHQIGSVSSPRSVLAAVVATGRSDYPNQINNVLCFPGFFRGLLDIRARLVNDEMKLAAAHAIASCVAKQELGPEYIIPSVFDKGVVPRVAKAVATAARETGVARRRTKLSDDFASR